MVGLSHRYRLTKIAVAVRILVSEIEIGRQVHNLFYSDGFMHNTFNNEYVE